MSSSVKLNLVARTDNINKARLEESYPKLCHGLGTLHQLYAIKLKGGMTPFALATPIPMLDKSQGGTWMHGESRYHRQSGKAYQLGCKHGVCAKQNVFHMHMCGPD